MSANNIKLRAMEVGEGSPDPPAFRPGLLQSAARINFYLQMRLPGWRENWAENREGLKHPSLPKRYDAELCRGVRSGILFLTGVWDGHTIVLHAREGVHRISCRVAEGYGPDDATTTGPAINNDWSLGANSRPVRGGHGDSEGGRPLCGRT